ncbi:MAG TPA: helix-turn-helix domain-containing protein, partial [Candidatus Acidoferrum sp.]|nr:helix-turn-helix domain-containing protein [Candidatus Acidoferrum sp.]
MTTRDDARRRGEARTDAARSAVGAAPVESLPERLLAARERKGVDLYRAERDTKIRAKYLGALERGDYRELPGAVYTKGFLRNYALYLGLDPDEILVQWRRERGEGTTAKEPVIVVPRPLTAPRQGLTFSPAIIVAALMTLVLIAFGTYLAVQVLRFGKPPTISVTEPSSAVSTVDETMTTYVLQGMTIPHGTVNVVDALNHTTQVSAGPDGSWSQSVPLRRGRNDFRISALDTETGRTSDTTVAIIINVPISIIQAPTLTVDSPGDGSSFQNGAIPVSGTTNAPQVVVSATPGGPVTGPGTGPGASASPVSKPTASPAPGPSAPAPVTVPVGSDGTFTTPFELTTG